jgi:hypothetical protein
VNNGHFIACTDLSAANAFRTGYQAMVGGHNIIYASGGHNFWGNVRVWNSSLYVDNNVGIGTTSPSQKLHVVGNILASCDITAFSDQRLKSNINIIPEALAKIHKLNGYTFDVSQNDYNNILKVSPQHTGLVAQEVLEVLPEAVHKDKEGYYSLAYGNMVGLLVQAVKELDNKCEKRLGDLHEAYQKEINQLKARIIQLEAGVSAM